MFATPGDMCVGQGPGCLIVAQFDDMSVDWRDPQGTVAIEVLSTRLHEARWVQCGLRKLFCNCVRYLTRVGTTSIFLALVQNTLLDQDFQRGEWPASLSSLRSSTFLRILTLFYLGW